MTPGDDDQPAPQAPEAPAFKKYASHDAVVAAEIKANDEAAAAGLTGVDRNAHVFIAMMLAVADAQPIYQETE